MRYYLIDLERTVKTISTWYWREHNQGTKKGYTRYLHEAHLFSEEEAKRIVEGDPDGKTIMIPEDVVEKIRAS